MYTPNAWSNTRNAVRDGVGRWRRAEYVPGGMTSARARGTVRTCTSARDNAVGAHARSRGACARARARPLACTLACGRARGRLFPSFFRRPPLQLPLHFPAAASPRARTPHPHAHAPTCYIARACTGESWLPHTLRECDTTTSQASLMRSPLDIKCKAVLSMRPVCHTTEPP